MSENRIKIKQEFLNVLNLDFLKNFQNTIEEVICSLMKHYQEVLSTFDAKEKSLYLLKVFLYLYENLLSKNYNFQSELKFNLIFEIISSKFLERNDCNWLNNAEQDLLKIIGCVCRICFSEVSKFNLLDLANFYVSNMTYIANNYDSENCNAKYLNFRLDILCTIYFEIINNLPKANVKKLIKVIKDTKINSNIEEHKLFSNLILFGNEEVFRKTLLSVIPKFVKCSDEVLFAVWQNILIILSNEHNEVQLLRLLLILCNLFNLSFYQDYETKNSQLIKLIFENKYYWKMIQIGLSKKDLKRSAIYMFKNTTEILLKTKANVICIDDDNSGSSLPLFAWWDSNFKNEMGYLYKKIIIILEYLDEQQIHIITPMYSIITEVIDEILTKLQNGINFNISWIWLIYEQLLQHESMQVVKWGLDSFFKLPIIVHSDIETIETSAALLVKSLNNINLYYNEGINISKALAQYFIKVLQIKTSKSFFSFLILKVCNFTWSPEALFFFVHALSQVPAKKIWQEKEINEIRLFITKTFKTQNKTIRLGIQHELLKTIRLLTDTKNTTFENVIMLLSNFLHLGGSFQRGNSIWNDYVYWIKNEYALEEIKAYLQDLNNEKMNEINEKYLALVFMLCADAYKNEKKTPTTECDSFNFFPAILFRQKLINFKNINKRLYCDKVLLNKILGIVCIILEESLINTKQDECLLLKAIFDYYTDILFYIQMEVMQNDKLQNFEEASSLVKSLEILLSSGSHYCKSQRNIAVDEIGSNISKKFINFNKSFDSAPFIKLYCCMQFLKIIINNDYYNSEVFNSKAIYMYLVNSVNNSIPKNTKLSNVALDLPTIWGKINTEFLECKWRILEFLISNSELSRKINEPLNHKTLLSLCLESLHVAGYKVLFPVMSILKNFLSKCEKTEAKEIIDYSWKLIMETRKTNYFKKLTKSFVEMLFHNELFMKKEQFSDIYLTYVNLLFSDSSLGVINTFIKHIQSLGIKENINYLFCEILSRALIFGPILRKGERLVFDVCTIIETHNMCPTSSHGDSSNEIRGRALEIMTSLDNANSEHMKFARNVIDKLMDTDSRLNAKKSRYFGDSLTHRIKHRIMQALLIIEPILKSCQETAKNLSDWLYNALLFQSPQPSVKYQQQWLLIRILIQNSESLNEFWSRLNDAVSNGAKTKGVCSLMIVAYHLYKLLPIDKKSWWTDEAFTSFLPFCMDQQFEIRLHSQVILKKIYESAKKLHLEEILEKYKKMNDGILKSLGRGSKNNGSKNVEKMEEDFYLNIFHPLNDYSLDTIFVDLPRLSNVGPDEWISLEVFKRCGFDQTKLKLCFNNSSDSLKNVESAKWSIDDFFASKETPKKDVLDNYQKKIIPMKGTEQDLLNNVGFYPCFQDTEIAKDGLVVVATLIDRIPNLGGLARTCEIFGAFEYILGSLKHLEDKQFASLSVTAEKWLTVKEVKKQNLAEYLLNMKGNGYAIIGAEQTLYSESLHTFKFPKKSVLVLGNEKEGIPPNLIPLFDVCVEIPQMGVIRSLNVHVTGALFVWEYAKQNYFLKNT